MPQHMFGFQESVDSATLQRLTAIQDDVLTPSGTERFLVPQNYRFLRWGFGSGANVTRMQIVTPSTTVQRQNLELIPRNQGANVPGLASPQIFVPRRPIALMPSETIEVQGAEDGAGATQLNAILNIGMEAMPEVPQGVIRTNRATGTATLTAFAWSPVTLTLDNDLEPGRYALVGFEAISATIIAARVLFQGGGFRPGVLGLPGTEAIATDFESTARNVYKWYNMGEFTHITIPQIEFLAAAADTAETVFLYSVRTGDV